MITFAGNPDAGGDYLEWRFQGKSAAQFSERIKSLSKQKRAKVLELYLGNNALLEVPKRIVLFPNLCE
jgi:hypothetical protein